MGSARKLSGIAVLHGGCRLRRTSDTTTFGRPADRLFLLWLAAIQRICRHDDASFMFCRRTRLSFPGAFTALPAEMARGENAVRAHSSHLSPRARLRLEFDSSFPDRL